MPDMELTVLVFLVQKPDLRTSVPDIEPTVHVHGLPAVRCPNLRHRPRDDPGHLLRPARGRQLVRTCLWRERP